jgi:CelD/BcsL family acetyltransferase involved in cellulose biosynthesis
MPGAVLGRDNPFSRLACLAPMELRCWNFPLPDTRAEYDKMLRSRDRKEQRRKRRNLVEALGAPILVHASSEHEKTRLFEALRLQRAARFQSQVRYDILGEPLFRRFYEAVVTEGFPDFADMAALEVGGRPIATLLALRCNGAYSLIMHSFDAQFEHLSPGIIAIDDLMSDLIESGTSICDFTIGNEPYKRQFCVQERLLYAGVEPLSAKGRVGAAILALKDQVEQEVAALYRKYRAMRGEKMRAAPQRAPEQAEVS